MNQAIDTSPSNPKQSTAWRRLRSLIGSTMFYLLVALLIIAVLAPFAWMIISSISLPSELASVPPHWFPQQPTLDRYLSLILGKNSGLPVPIAATKFIHSLGNSLVISSATTIVCIIAGTLAAYAIVRLPVPGKGGFMFGMLAAQMLPVITVIIPLFLLMQAIKFTDTWHGMIILYSGYMLPTVIWIMYGYFQTLPEELEEAGMIDGCSRIGAFLRVVLPISGPGIVAITAFAFLYTWNEFFMALIFTGANTKTITVLITEFSNQAGIDYGLMTTGGVIGSIPPIIIVLLLQKYIVAGLTSGAVKG
jgi:multiple sugar transport system permease protein